MAVQSDWQKYSAAWNDWQQRGGRASGPPPKEVRDMIRAQGIARDAELKAKGYGPARFDKLNESINKQLKAATNRELKKHGPTRGEILTAAKAGKRLIANTPSDCFASVEWKDGICTMEFARDGYVLDEPMDVEDFLDFAQADSLGKFYNAEIR
jgi:hypothetical protein